MDNETVSISKKTEYLKMRDSSLNVSQKVECYNCTITLVIPEQFSRVMNLIKDLLKQNLPTIDV